jgi:hypothetical protein
LHYHLEQALKIKSIISKHFKIETMKLALIALATEISLARMFVGSWGWAVVIVVLYCTLVYVFIACKVLLSKKQNTSNIKPGSTMLQGAINGNTKRKELFCDICTQYEMMQ